MLFTSTIHNPVTRIFHRLFQLNKFLFQSRKKERNQSHLFDLKDKYLLEQPID